MARWVANEDIVYQIPRGRARGKGHFYQKSFRGPAEGRLGGGGRDKRVPPEFVLTSLVGGRDKRVPPERVFTSLVGGRDKRVPPEHRCAR